MAECDDQGKPICSFDKLPKGIPIYGAERYTYRRAPHCRDRRGYKIEKG